MPLSFSSSLKNTLWIGVAACLALTSCKDDDDSQEPSYQVPATYNFENVSYAGQTDRIKMLDELTKYMKSANASGIALDGQKLKNMYANQNAPFADAALNSSAKKLKDKTFLTDQAMIEGYLEQLATASQSKVPGANGVAGVVTSKDGSRKYLFDANGKEFAQIIEKGLMGSVFYYQSTGVYLTEEKTGDAVDNTTVKPGEGTTMEHHWDEAFGYLGVPKDFPANVDANQLFFWGKYINSRDAKLGSNAKIMNAFLKGRAAISNKAMKGKNEAISVIREEWEKVVAATAISYLNQARTNISDDALRNHALSEGTAFINALRYNPAKKITDTQIGQAVSFVGDNFYTVKATDLDKAKDLLASVYGLNDMKDSF